MKKVLCCYLTNNKDTNKLETIKSLPCILKLLKHLKYYLKLSTELSHSKTSPTAF